MTDYQMAGLFVAGKLIDIVLQVTITGAVLALFGLFAWFVGRIGGGDEKPN